MRWRASDVGGVVHGLVWKIASLLSKAGFLFLVAPNLPDGEFSRYVFLTTLALLIGRVIALGSSDQLVLAVRGRPAEALRFLPLYRTVFGVAICLLLVGWMFPAPATRVAALAGILVSSSLLEGMIRSLTPAWYERLINVPPIVFLSIALVGQDMTALNLILVYALATVGAQGWVAVAHNGGFKFLQHVATPVNPSEVVALARAGLQKMVSEVTLVMNMRGLILWPRIVLGRYPSDSLAFALSIAEAVSTLPMVAVNRRYAAAASDDRDRPYGMRFPLLLVGGMSVTGVAAAILGASIPAGLTTRLNWADLCWAMVFFGVVTAYYDLRYFRWAGTPNVHRYTAFQVGFFLLQGMVVAVLPTVAQITAVSMLGVACLFAWLARESAAWSNGVGRP